MPGIRKTPAQSDSALISVRVVPRSSRISIQKEEAGGGYRIRLTAPPVEGEANEQLIRVLSKRLSVPRRRLAIVSGEGSRRKRVRVEGLSESQVETILKEG
jgi:uncharacterized protein (TIGR00251 family)